MLPPRNASSLALAVRLSVLTALLTLTGCGTQAPTTDQIRTAYAAHLAADPVHKEGLRANEAPAVIPQQEPACRSDGNGHFDCRIRVVFETSSSRRSQEQMIHIRRENGAWIIDSVN